MSLTEKEKEKIEEEERYRAKTRKKLENEKEWKPIKKTPWYKPKGAGAWGCLTFIVLIVIIGILGGSGSSDKSEKQESASKPTPTPKRNDFRASVEFTGTKFIISNLDSANCINAKMEINGGIIRSGYVLEGYTLEAGSTYEVGTLQFAKSDGTRLNPLEIKPKDFYILCRGGNALDGASWLGNF